MLFQDSDTGFPIRYRLDVNLFNLRKLEAKTKVQTDVLKVYFLVSENCLSQIFYNFFNKGEIFSCHN